MTNIHTRVGDVPIPRDEDKLGALVLSYISGITPSDKSLAKTVSDLQGSEVDAQTLFEQWFTYQEEDIAIKAHILTEVLQSLDFSKRKVKKRVESPNYLALVRKSLRDLSADESQQKHHMIGNLLYNAAVLDLTPDNILKIFISWIENYTDEHFAVLKEIADRGPLTRRDIWLYIHDKIPSEDSAAAEFYRLVIFDLSVGHLIRQQREKDYYGKVVKKRNPAEMSQDQPTEFTTTFGDEKLYELTELGKQFVRYTF